MSNIQFKSPNLSHAKDIIRLVDSTPRLDRNSKYAYALWCSHFAPHSVVAIRDEEVIGFLTGFRSPTHPDTYFLWQTATKHRHGVAGLGVDMIDFAVRREIDNGATKIEASVDNDNKPIRVLMKSLAKRLNGRVEEELLYPGSLLSTEDDQHHDEMLMRICLPQGARMERAPQLSIAASRKEAMV
ncbi:GNAT family N-acetyltransferase [Pseudovibrio exalbescens]|uniref:GNAT family N-acetyltransferase n=1 Tax=Pseudovibrio exalbescens TaxID=197461 RepID=UPI0015E12833|nr:GNAT family N-acetyltransferase [Pseudovibrio exalbescens]